MKPIINVTTICVSIVLLTVCSCSKRPVQSTQTIWRTEYVRDTSLALCKRITDPDSAIVFMDHLFVPMFSDKGINFNNHLEQMAQARIPGVTSKGCVISEYYCPNYIVGKDVEVAFALFAHPSQLQEWRALSKNFTEKNKEWNMQILFVNMYCQILSSIKIKNGIIIRAR